MIAVSIDTASDLAGLCLSEDGALLTALTWRTRQNHARELLPALDYLLSGRGLVKADIGAVCVCTGPGSYSGLRVGLSTAKTLAYALGVPIVGVGRLAADAEPLALEGGPPVMAVHAAGRADLAWAVYARAGGGLRELAAPRLGPAESLLAALSRGMALCGDIPEALAARTAAAGATLAPPGSGRVLALARLGQARLAAGDVDDADALVPLYLREPAIGPQPPRG